MKYLLTILLLTGCASTADVYTQKPISGKKAQLVIYRPSELFGADEYIEINGTEVCRLGRNSYFARDVSPGITTVSITTLSDKSELSLNTEAGERHYIGVSTNSGKTAAGIGGGLLGAAIVGGDDYYIRQVSPAEGQRVVADKKESVTCKNNYAAL